MTMQVFELPAAIPGRELMVRVDTCGHQSVRTIWLPR